MKKLVFWLVAVIVVVLGCYAYWTWKSNAIYRIPGLASGNGRLEATEVNISTKLAGRIDSITVEEGQLVKKGQLLGKMQTNVLEAELAQAKAKLKQAEAAEHSAQAVIAVRQGELEAAKAVVTQKKSRADGDKKRYERALEMFKKAAISRQNFENDETVYLASKAELEAALASVKQAEAAVIAARAEAGGAAANILAAKADIQRIQADISDSDLVAPLGGRIQYKISEVGEVLSAGGKVLNLVDLTDVYMTFYLPEAIAGKVAIGADVRLVLDAMPSRPIPAKVSFVASVAQFTPKTVETKIEREKLMFRVKAKIAPELLNEFIEYVKTGVPGVAWVKVDPATPWPKELQNPRWDKGETAK